MAQPRQEQLRTLRDMLKLETDFEYLQRVAGPRAEVMTLNRIRSKVRARTTDKVWAEARYLPIVYANEPLKSNVTGAPVRSTIKRRTINKRIHTSKATINKRNSKVSGYISPIPVISLSGVKKRGTNKTVTKGQYVRQRKGGPKARSSKLFGVKVGGLNIPGGFVQTIRKKKVNVQIFKKKQFKTWKDGHYGWNYRPGEGNEARMPYDVVKFSLQKVFEKHFEPTIYKTVDEEWNEEYSRALGVAAGRILGNVKK